MADDEDDFEQKPTPPPRTGNTARSWRMSDSERDRHRRTWVRGVPVVRPEPADEVTAPLELLLNGQLDVDDYAQIEALRRSADDPYVLVMNLAKAISRHRDKERSGSREIEIKVVKAIEAQTKEAAAQSTRIAALEATSSASTTRVIEIAARVVEIASKVDCEDKDRPGLRQEVQRLKPLGAFAKWALGIAGSAALGIGIFLYTRGVTEGAEREQLKRALRDIDDMQQEIRGLKQLKGTP
jgi:hypothetical protein